MKFYLKKFKYLAIAIVVLIIGLLGAYLLNKNHFFDKLSAPKSKYSAFLIETYDDIKQNYWNKIPDDQLIGLYSSGIEKIGSQIITIKPKDRQGLIKTIDGALEKIGDDAKKKEFTTTLADAVLASLTPQGRSRLYSQIQETSLNNNVNNITPGGDMYKDLGVSIDASQTAIQKTYEAQSQNLAKDNSAEGKAKLAQVTKAYQTLSDTTSKKIYDQMGIEPTIEYKLINPNVFYIHLTKFSPTTSDDLARVTAKVDQGNALDTLILDLRDNIGGSIDELPYFLGPFIGNDQYAYQFFHQGEKTDFKTKTGWLNSLVRYKKIVVLVNGGTMSSAEVMAATLKKYNVGVLVGTTTKGWGTVEKVFELQNQIDDSEKYSVFLVHSLTLREDGQPIEGLGIEPNINITNKGWEKELYSRFGSQILINAVKEVL